MGTPCINAFSSDATPEKTELSFEQWYHEVPCIKDHYPEEVVQESIIQSLKGAVADMTRYVGPTTTVDHIVHTVSHLWHCGLIQCVHAKLYKVSQGNNKKVPSFAMKLEGTLNQIELQCPGRMMDLRGPTTPQGLPLP